MKSYLATAGKYLAWAAFVLGVLEECRRALESLNVDITWPIALITVGGVVMAKLSRAPGHLTKTEAEELAEEVAETRARDRVKAALQAVQGERK